MTICRFDRHPGRLYHLKHRNLPCLHLGNGPLHGYRSSLTSFTRIIYLCCCCCFFSWIRRSETLCLMSDFSHTRNCLQPASPTELVKSLSTKTSKSSLLSIFTRFRHGCLRRLGVSSKMMLGLLRLALKLLYMEFNIYRRRTCNRAFCIDTVSV